MASGQHEQYFESLQLSAAEFSERFDDVYLELKRIAANHMRLERSEHTLQPTALVHEAYVRLTAGSSVTIRGKAHLLAIASRSMRQVLIDHARRRLTEKRSGKFLDPWLELDKHLTICTPESYIDLNQALNELARLDAREAGIIELRFFGGLSVREIASLYGLSDRMVRYETVHALAWLRERLSAN